MPGFAEVTKEQKYIEPSLHPSLVKAILSLSNSEKHRANYIWQDFAVKPLTLFYVIKETWTWPYDSRTANLAACVAVKQCLLPSHQIPKQQVNFDSYKLQILIGKSNFCSPSEQNVVWMVVQFLLESPYMISKDTDPSVAGLIKQKVYVIEKWNGFGLIYSLWLFIYFKLECSALVHSSRQLQQYLTKVQKDRQAPCDLPTSHWVCHRGTTWTQQNLHLH